MDIRLRDLAIFVYNSGVALSGGFIAFTFEMTSYAELVPFSIGLGFLWTLYYRSVMEEKLSPDEDDGESEEREPPSQAEPDDEEPPEQGGPDAPWE
ncbi:MAG: hypothetical protein ABEJ47_00820 [Halorhabdus sp.]